MVYGDIDRKRDLNKFQPTRDAVGYRLEGDVVSLLGERFGETRTIKSKFSSNQFIENHRMINFNQVINSGHHVLRDTSVSDSSLPIRPVSFIIGQVALNISVFKETMTP